jgi:multidrug efflux pump subunit AcrB
MITSTIVALSINPFLTNLFYVSKNSKITKTTKFKLLYKKIIGNLKNKLNLKKLYFNFLSYFLDDEKPFRITVFKIFFWIILLAILILPPAMLVFKMRMLPKSNQNQIYLRVDLPSDTTYNSTEKLSKDLNSFLLEKY